MTFLDVPDALEIVVMHGVMVLIGIVTTVISLRKKTPEWVAGIAIAVYGIGTGSLLLALRSAYESYTAVSTNPSSDPQLGATNYDATFRSLVDWSTRAESLGSCLPVMGLLLIAIIGVVATTKKFIVMAMGLAAASHGLYILNCAHAAQAVLNGGFGDDYRFRTITLVAALTFGLGAVVALAGVIRDSRRPKTTPPGNEPS